MRQLTIDLTDLGGQSHPDDWVEIWAPEHRGSTERPGGIITTAQRIITLTDGTATIDVEPGPLYIQLNCRQIADNQARKIIIPEGEGPVTLRSVIEGTFTYDPPIVSVVQKAADAVAKAHQAVLAAQKRVEEAEKNTLNAANTATTTAKEAKTALEDAQNTLTQAQQLLKDAQASAQAITTIGEAVNKHAETIQQQTTANQTHAETATNAARTATEKATQAEEAARRAVAAAESAKTGAPDGGWPLESLAEEVRAELGKAPDATSSVKGVVKLAGDLAGTADAPTVPGLASKADTSTVQALEQKIGALPDAVAVVEQAATVDATAGKLVKRDDAGRVKVADPVSEEHATSKKYVDAAVSDGLGGLRFMVVKEKPETPDDNVVYLVTGQEEA